MQKLTNHHKMSHELLYNILVPSHTIHHVACNCICLLVVHHAALVVHLPVVRNNLMCHNLLRAYKI